jgi:uncharacterized membrane protein YjgN (DUF898 family)
MRRHLEFRGGSTSLFGPILGLAFFSAITFGIYFPWGYVRLRRKILENTYLDGQPLAFDGTGGQFFGLCLKIFILTLITLGIYGFLCFPIVAILKWDAEHTVYPNGKRAEYRGSAIDMFVQVLIVGILSAITFGIYGFWGYVRIRKHILSQTFLDEQPLEFTGTGGQYIGVALVNMLLSLITLGIYALLGCIVVRELRWDAPNTLVPWTPQTAASYGGDTRPIQVTVNVNQ